MPSLAWSSRAELHDLLYRGDVLDTGAEFPEGDATALEALVDAAARPGMIAIEIGSWKGRSTSILAAAVRGRAHGGRVYAVDTWAGSPGVPHHAVAQAADVFACFRGNLQALGLWDAVRPLVMDSLSAAAVLADGIADLVFLDADHRYEPVRRDLEAWWPKVRPGGIFAGHDCEQSYARFPPALQARIDASLDQDYITNLYRSRPDLGVHPGVVKALHERLGTGFVVTPGSVVWHVVKATVGATV